MKKNTPTIILAVVACIAIIMTCVFGVQKGNIQKDADAVKAELEAKISQLETSATDASAAAASELEAAKTAAETALADAAAAAQTELETAKADAAAALESAKAELQSQIDALSAEKEAVETKAAEAATEAATALETAKAELQAQIDSLTAEKEAAETKAAETLEAAKAELQGQIDSLTAEKEALEKKLTDAAADAEATLTAAKAELQAQIENLTAEKEAVEAQAAETLEATKAELQSQIDSVTAEKEAVDAQLAEAMAALATGLSADAEAVLQEQIADLTNKLAKTERALTAARSNAYIMYASADWSVQNWGVEDSSDGVIMVNPANVTGEGDYTVSLIFDEPKEGLAFTALGINDGEINLPGYFIKLNAIRVNGEPIDFKVGYTSSDDGRVTRMNIYNEWVSELPEDARCYDGNLAEAAAVIVDKEAFASVASVAVDFSILANPVDTGFIMYANSDWSAQNWGGVDSDDGSVKVTPAEITGPGNYNTSIEFATPAEGLAFAALGIQRGEITYPNYFLTINHILVNGEKIEALEGKKGYTSSDDGITTRMNIYNEWVSELPEDARSLDGDLSNVAPVWVNTEDFASVSSIEINFDIQPISAYLMFANSDWSIQNWGYASSEDVYVVPAAITGEGLFTTSLTFTNPSEGLAFLALGVKNGEALLPGYIFQIVSVSINGDEDSIMNGMSYTNSDDGAETRSNIYNEWVSALPDDARSEVELQDCSPIIVDAADFTDVKTITVIFKVIKGKEIVKEEAVEETMSQEEADALKANGFHAYIGVQGKDTYIFRNAWNDNYGMNDEEHPYFNRLTGWGGEEGDGSVDFGGTFVDAEITGDGEYAVSLTTGEMGFGTTESFNLLFVSTDIPSKLVKDGYLTIDQVKTKIGDAATKEYTEVDLEGDYAMIKVIDVYNQAQDPFGYTVPGADTPITITFTVSGW